MPFIASFKRLCFLMHTESLIEKLISELHLCRETLVRYRVEAG